VSMLNNICHKSLEEAEEYKVGIKTEGAAAIAMPRIMADPETCYHAALIGTKQTIKQISTSTLRRELNVGSGRKSEEPAQLEFWQA